MMAQASRHQEQEAIGQFSIFDGMEEHQEPSLPDVPEWKENQLLAYERESVGFYITGHPLAAYETDMKRYVTTTTETLGQVPENKEVIICGILAGISQKLTKKNEKMAIMSLEDLSGTVEVVVFPELYRTSQHLLVTDAPLIVRGTVEHNEQGSKIKSLSLALLTDMKKRSTSRVDIRLNATGLTRDELVKVKDLLLRHRGDIPVVLRLQNPSRKESIISVGREIRVAPSDQLIAEIEALLGPGAVSLN
jgi:DNA polymerase-3 subunit alpha